MVTIDACNVYYMQLNQEVRRVLKRGSREILLKNVNGQRYIACGVRGNSRLTVEGVPGNDLAAFMDGPEIVVRGNAQDAVANTMNSGRVIIHGDAGDTLGYAMRGGEVFVRGNVGYRVGIHMKEYGEQVPLLVIGGKAGDFLGEYMAGGRIVVLGLPDANSVTGSYCGTGMHGGIMYLRGQVPACKLGREVRVDDLNSGDREFLEEIILRFTSYFDNISLPLSKELSFTKLVPVGNRPYGKLYASF